MIYLDSAATGKYTDKDEIIISTMVDVMRNYWQNPSSLYATGVKAEIERCRENIAKSINAEPDEIYFTSGASESNNWVVRGWVDEELFRTGGMVNIITTPIEHKSISEAVKNRVLGAVVRYCEVDKFGLVDIGSLENLLKFAVNRPVLVSVGLANSEIGVVQDIRAISNLVHSYNKVFHTDATQAYLKIPIDVKEMGIDMMSVSGHKISPVLKGIGFLYKKNGVDIQPLIYGSQQRNLRGGTENTFGIIGLSKAIELYKPILSFEDYTKVYSKFNYFKNQLKKRFGCKINGHWEDKYVLPNIISATFPQDITAESLLYMLDLSDIEVSVGSACDSKSIVPSRVLKTIGLSNEEAAKTMRFSLSDSTTYKDIDYVLDEIEKSLKLIEMQEDD